jgi:hypothetical protein
MTFGKWLYERLRRRWDHNIKTHLTVRGCENGRRMKLPQDRFQWRALILAILNILFFYLILSLIGVHSQVMTILKI